MSMDKTLRTALAARLRGISHMGTVHDYERFAKDEPAFRALYTRGNKVLGWHIKRGPVKETVFDSQVNRVRTRWTIRGLAALVDGKASELALDALVDTIRQVFRRFPEFKNSQGQGYARTVTDEGAGIQVEESGPVMFAGLLCHSVRLSLVTEHFEEIEPKLSEDAGVAGFDENGNPVETPSGTPVCPDDAFQISLAVFAGDPEWQQHVKENKENTGHA